MNKTELVKILNNTAWLVLDKFIRMAASLFLIGWMARYLGPEKFGLFNYSLAIVALFTSIGTLGLSNIVVRDLVKQSPIHASATLGTSFILQAIGGVTACILAISTIFIIRPEDNDGQLIVGIMSLTMVFKASDVVRYWFEAHVQSKYAVLVDNGIFFVFALLKIILIFYKASLIAFVWLLVAEAALVALLLFAVYIYKNKDIKKWRFQYTRAKVLLKDSWHLILSGLTVMLYMRIDQIMLGQMVDVQAVGVYSAAARISEVWYFIPMAIASSVYPSIIGAKQQSQLMYEKKLIKIMQLLFILAVTLAIPISFFAEYIIYILYGTNYEKSTNILIVHIWGGIFVFIGVISSRWFIIENLQKYTFYRTLAGCIINIALNFLLIPLYGALGSAWASVVSQAIASIFFNAVNTKTRPLFLMQLAASGLYKHKFK